MLRKHILNILTGRLAPSLAPGLFTLSSHYSIHSIYDTKSMFFWTLCFPDSVLPFIKFISSDISFPSLSQSGIEFILQSLVNFHVLHPKLRQIGFVPHDSAKWLMVASWGSDKDPEAKIYLGSIENDVMIREQPLLWTQVECVEASVSSIVSLALQTL